MSEFTPPDKVTPPFFRFIYDPQTDRLQITAHSKPAVGYEGADFGACLTRAEAVSMLVHFMKHFESESSFIGSIPAVKGK